MKKFNKILSVGLSLIMCVSMAAPALAASFDDLQQAINGGAYGGAETGSQIEGTNRYGYGWNEATNNWGIEAWNDGDTRNIQLNENVEFDKNGADNGRGSDNGGNGAIWVWRDDKNVSIDLNGHDIDMNPDAVLNTEDGKFYEAEKDEDGNKIATETEATDLNTGTIFLVTGGNLTVTDSEGTGKITGGNASIGNSHWDETSQSYTSYKEGNNTGAGAVYVENNGSFTMVGGSVSGNRSTGPVICAENTQGAKNNSNLKVTLDGVTVENNYTEAGGTIYFRAQAGTVDATIKNCTITGNVAEGDVIDFGIFGNGQSLNALIKNTTIIGNRVDKDNERIGDHGGVALWQGAGKTLNVTIDGCTIQDNEGGCTGIYYDNCGENGLVITEGNNTICGNAGQDVTNGVSVKYQDGTTLNAMHTDAYWESIEGVSDGEANCVEGGSISYTCPFCKAVHTVQTGIDPDNHDMGEWEVTKEPGIGVAGEEARVCKRCDHTETRPLDPLTDETPDKTPDETPGKTPDETPDETPGTPSTGTPVTATPVVSTPVTGDSTVEISDDEVPLADIFTRADAIGYLWEQTGSPEWELSDFEDVPEDHEWAVAIGWAEDMGIALPDEDGNFRPDDLVLRSTEDVEGEFQEFLNRYAVYAGIELEDGELFIELEGLPIDFITREEAEEIFDMFFAKLDAALEEKAA
ncbi:MAG: hypothetical protein HDT15_11345 [Oscillibacter sp.]|nr:hypothetical protein [Oscillibacter sp.]